MSISVIPGFRVSHLPVTCDLRLLFCTRKKEKKNACSQVISQYNIHLQITREICALMCASCGYFDKLNYSVEKGSWLSHEENNNLIFITVQ